ncbi:MAG: leucine-rich repeat protein, partial [Porticoccaceae bacterium]
MNLSNKLCSSRVCVALLFFISFLSPTTQALDDGSWAYTVDGNAATITGRVNSCPADVNIPDKVDGYTVTKIGASAFYNSGVVTVKIPNTVLSIGGAAFESNSIASIDLPNGLADIGSGAFSSNVLTNIIIPNTVVSIGGAAFSHNKLTSVVIPNGLTELPDSIFAHNALTSVAIPDSVITIKRSAFYSNAFTSIIIPKNVTSIGQLAFTYNEAAYYHFEGSRPEIHEEAFGTGLKLKRITYCDTEGWPGDETWLFRARGRDKTLIYPTNDCYGYLPIPEHTFNADIAFILKGYGGGTAIPNINSFDEEAQRVVAAIGALSLETHSYEIFDGGIESRGMDDYLLSAEPEAAGLANAMMKDVRLPANHEKYKKIIYLWSTGVQYDNWAGAFAGGCRGFGLVDSEGRELENIHISQDYGDQCAFVDLQTYTSSRTKVMVHELTHLYGHGGHDSDSVESWFEYSMMHGSAYGPIDTYPIWNRIYITKWLTEENITEDRNQLTDYSGSSDKAGKYLLRLSEKNDFNCQDENRNPTRCHRYQELHKGTLIQNRGTFIRNGESYFQGGVVFEPVMDVDDITTPSIESITVTNNVSTSEGIKDQITLVFSENITLGKGTITVYENDYSKEQGFSISVNRLPQNSDGWDGRGGTALADISGKNLVITSVMNGEKNYSIKFGQGSIIDWGGNSVAGKYCAFASDTDDTTDSDDDGIFDCADAFPLDASEIADNDSDGIGDNTDTDADGDGISDSEDVFPLDASESLDADGDGIGNNRDPNDDNDSHDDWRDIFPFDPSETTDTDSDGIGNNADSDDDDDGVSDNLDAYPLDSSEWSDTDGDGIGDNTEIDDDCDCVIDTEDSFPLDSTESVDTDSDGTGNNADTDDDNDNVLDGDDAFPLDAAESVDTDSDGIGNNADTDDDNDSVLDDDDAFPLDSTETLDTDSDGTGNNADTDDDGDGVADGSDAFPLDSAETLDTDSDGTGNNADTDDDNDNILDGDDAFPLDAAESVDTDSDGIGNNADTDDDNDSVLDDDDAFPLDSTETLD